MYSAADHAHMARALRLAKKGLCNTDPNPTVGCVIVNEAAIVGEGWTQPAGGPHAERVALRQAGEAASGALVYVTLEPCSHVGRTGPCTQALIDNGVGRVICAALDPNPLVSGSGVEKLRSAGVAVDVGLLESQARQLNIGFFSRMIRDRPWVRSKLAASLDGRTALANGVSQWITSPHARADGHSWRARSSAVMTGSGTILADNPTLTARHVAEESQILQPCRVVIDSRLRTPVDARVLAADGDAHIFTISNDAAAIERLLEAGAFVHQVTGTQGCDLATVFRELAEQEINDVWVEAGAGLNGALLAAGLVDEVVIYLAPKLLGDSARGMVSIGDLSVIADGIELEIVDCRSVGPDLRITARPSNVAGLL